MVGITFLNINDQKNKNKTEIVVSGPLDLRPSLKYDLGPLEKSRTPVANNLPVFFEGSFFYLRSK